MAYPSSRSRLATNLKAPLARPSRGSWAAHRGNIVVASVRRLRQSLTWPSRQEIGAPGRTNDHSAPADLRHSLDSHHPEGCSPNRLPTSESTVRVSRSGRRLESDGSADMADQWCGAATWHSPIAGLTGN